DVNKENKIEKRKQREMKLELDYVKSYFGIIKIAEFSSLGISWICMTTYFDSTFSQMGGKNVFFIATSMASWIIVLLWFITFLTSQCYRTPSPTKMLIIGILHLAFFNLHLISGALVIDSKTNSEMSCRTIAYHECTIQKYNCAAAFGIISSILFLIDGALHIVQRKRLFPASMSVEEPASMTEEVVLKITTQSKSSTEKATESTTEEATDSTKEATESTKETTGSTTEATESTTEATKSTTKEASDSTEEASKPTTEASEPATEASEPATEASEPTTEAAEPTIEASEPTTEASEPTTEASEPTIG
uniref:MARVEL domain-containing protein n=1 Tax=Clytia hemisphaerica TaxID=252671 RepID=A0A7M5XGN6_9CNID